MGHNLIINGIDHPSVTGVNGILAKAWLPHWYASEERKGLLKALAACTSRAEWPEIVKQWGEKLRCTDSLCVCEAAKKKTAGGTAGTSFHAAVEALMLGKPLPTLTVAEARAFKRFVGWVKKHTLAPLVVGDKPMLEVHITHPVWKYVGTFDGLCYVDGILRLVDWKTSNSMDPTFKLQIAAYAKAAVDMGMIPEMPGGLILRLDKREKPWGRAVEEEWIEPKEMEANFQVFASLRRPYDYCMRNNMLRIDR